MRFALPLFLAFSFLLLAALPANAQDGSKPAVAKDGGSTADAAAKEPAVASATKPAAKAPAPLPVVDPDNPSQIFGFIIEAFKTGKWAWGIGLVFMLMARPGNHHVFQGLRKLPHGLGCGSEQHTVVFIKQCIRISVDIPQ